MVIATSSQKKAICTMFGCGHASGSEVQLCFYTSYCTKEIPGFHSCTPVFYVDVCHHGTAYDSRDQP